MVQINIIIVNFNSKLNTLRTYGALVHQSVQNFRAVIIENGCRKDEILEDNGLTHLFLNQNYGFPAAVNVGVKACTEEWVLVLNNDCFLREDFLEKMTRAVEENPEYAIFSPKIYQGDDKKEKNIIYACGDRIDKKGLAGNIGRGEEDRGQYDHQKEVPLASFACILIKKEVLEKFPLDESYFGYYEDVDFCLRVARAGYKIRFVPQAVCYHSGEASFRKLNNLDNEMRQFRNLSFTLIKNYSLFHIVRHWMIFNLKSFRYYFFMKKQWKFLRVEWQIIRRFCGFV